MTPNVLLELEAIIELEVAIGIAQLEAMLAEVAS